MKKASNQVTKLFVNEQSILAEVRRAQFCLHTKTVPRCYINQKSNITDSAWLTFGNLPKTLQKEKIMFNLSPSGNLFQACNLLYSGLRYLDSFGVKNIQVMPIPMKGIGIAINDRLRRASYQN